MVLVNPELTGREFSSDRHADDTESLSVDETRLDADALARVRSGETEAFGELWTRYERRARSFSRRLAPELDPDDIVADVFAGILNALVNGTGPQGPFLPYLYVAIRSRAIRSTDKTPMADDLDSLDELSVPDPSGRIDERMLLRQAFESLPERWRSALWYTLVAGYSARETGEKLGGLSSEAVDALTMRARKGLRSAWLSCHVEATPDSSECRWAVSQLVSASTRAAPDRIRTRLDDHLDECVRCQRVKSQVSLAKWSAMLALLPAAVAGGAAVMQPASPSSAPAASGGSPSPAPTSVVSGGSRSAISRSNAPAPSRLASPASRASVKTGERALVRGAERATSSAAPRTAVAGGRVSTGSQAAGSGARAGIAGTAQTNVPVSIFSASSLMPAVAACAGAAAVVALVSSIVFPSSSVAGDEPFAATAAVEPLIPPMELPSSSHAGTPPVTAETVFIWDETQMEEPVEVVQPQSAEPAAEPAVAEPTTLQATFPVSCDVFEDDEATTGGTPELTGQVIMVTASIGIPGGVRSGQTLDLSTVALQMEAPATMANYIRGEGGRNVFGSVSTWASIIRPSGAADTQATVSAPIDYVTGITQDTPFTLTSTADFGSYTVAESGNHQVWFGNASPSDPSPVITVTITGDDGPGDGSGNTADYSLQCRTNQQVRIGDVSAS